MSGNQLKRPEKPRTEPSQAMCAKKKNKQMGEPRDSTQLPANAHIMHSSENNVCSEERLLSQRKATVSTVSTVFTKLLNKTTKKEQLHSNKPKNAHNYKKECNCARSEPETPSGSWLTPQPFPYQIKAALNAVYDGHNLIADEPGLGKTITAILTASMFQTLKVLVICPPALITNWANEITRSNHLDHMGEGNRTGELVTITSKNKTTPTIPNTGYVVTSDTLVTARKTLMQDLTAHQWDLLIIDESHRLKNYRAKRTRAVWHLSKACKQVIALTGTPIVSNPLDLLPTLGMLGQLKHFPDNYVYAYTKPNFWGERIPRQENLSDLHDRLEQHVWTRRTKNEVLTELPVKSRHTHYVDVEAELIQEAFQPIEQKLLTHVEKYGMGAVDGWVKEARPHVSQMRRGTGLAKVPAAVDWIGRHLEGTTGRPLIVWCIHTDVITGLRDAIREEHPHTVVRTFYGATPRMERDQTVSDFQAGKVDVLIAQIMAAGTGLTLTRSSDALFVETDWTPANVVQAEDRIHRISQDQRVTITTLIAENTLDPVIHRVLMENIRTLDEVTPGSDHRVTDVGAGVRVSDVLSRYAADVLARVGRIF